MWDQYNQGSYCDKAQEKGQGIKKIPYDKSLL
jgi:hypothetical protein